MPDSREHLEKARHNEAFVGQFNVEESPYLDWVVTGYFYAAVHYVEAYLARSNRHSTDHRARDSAVRRDAVLATVYNEYSDLKNDSINARYHMYRFAPDEVRNISAARFGTIKTRLLAHI